MDGLCGHCVMKLSQTEKDKHYMVSYLESKIGKHIKQSRMVVTWAWEVEEMEREWSKGTNFQL